MVIGQTKFVSNVSLEELETELNEFLKGISATDLIDIKHGVAHEAVNTDTETGVYSRIVFTALVIYKVSLEVDRASRTI